MRNYVVAMALLLLATMGNATQYDESAFWAGEVAAIQTLDDNELTIANQDVSISTKEVLITYKWIGSNKMDVMTDLAAITGIYVSMTQTYDCKIGDLRVVATDGDEKTTMRLSYNTAKNTDMENGNEVLAVMMELMESAETE